MSVKLKTIKNSASKILTLDSEALPEVIDVNEQFFTLKVYYTLILNNSAKNPLQYTKVKLTFTSQKQNSQGNTKEYSEDLNSSFVKRNIIGKNYQRNSSTSNFVQNSNFKKTFSVKPTISPAAQAKYDIAATLINNINKKPGEVNSITSKTAFIGDKIVKALKEKVYFTDLILPEFVSTYQEKRYSSAGSITFQDFKNELIRENLSISQIVLNYISDSINLNSHFSSQLIDTILNTNNSAQINNQSLNYYVKQNTSKYLESLTLSEVVNLPISLLQEGSVFLKLSLFAGNAPNTEDEQLVIPINLARCLEAYYNNIQAINTNVSKTHVNSLVNSVSISPLLTAVDEKKIRGFNLYIKNFSNDNGKFAFIKNLEKNEVYTEFFDTNSNYQACYRVKPVTAFGESNIFSDVLFSSLPNNVSIKSKSLFFYVRQIDISNIELNIKLNALLNVNKLKIYRRDCTNSSNSDFEVIRTSNITETINSFILNDNNILLGHFYEYFIEVFDNNNILVGVTLPQFVEVKYINTNAYSVELNNINIDNNSIQFSISATKLKKNLKIALLKAEEDKLIIGSPTQQISTEEKDFEETLYHKVTRIDQIDGRRESFDIITNGTFIDNQETQIQSNISSLVSGRQYTYEVESYKRNPVNLIKNFLSTGTSDSGKEWFYKPSKWKSPNVINTGILQADEDNELEKDLFMTDFIGITIAQNIEFNTESTSILVQSVSVERLTRTMMKISWPSVNGAFDCFIVSKVVNGKKFIIGTTSDFYIYHKINFDSDIGTMYYDVIPVKNDYSLGESTSSNPLLISPDTVDKI